MYPPVIKRGNVKSPIINGDLMRKSSINGGFETMPG
jgi:hypothetical protein